MKTTIMKRIIYLLVIFGFLSLGACNEWLDVGPSNQTSREDLFKQGVGYQVALNGIYQELSESDLYGQQLSWGMLSAMGQDYNSTDTTKLSETYKDAAKYDYKSFRVEPVIDQMWSKMHNAIANCNSLIDGVENMSNVDMFQFREFERNAILGEAYALRGMIHLDLMRLFAPAPTSANKNNKYLAYITEFPTKIGIPVSQNDYIAKMIADFKRGQELTASMDTLPEYNTFAFNTSNANRLEGVGGVSSFFKFRSTRLNYYATTCMMARAYLYAGDKPNALIEAKKIYNLIQTNYNFKAGHKFTPSNELNNPEKNSRNIKSHWDIMFALFNTEEVSKILYNYTQYNTLPLRDLKGWFAKTESDYRKGYLTYNVKGVGDLSVKWIASNDSRISRVMHPLIPVFRMAELYYIIAESCYDTDMALAQKCFTEIKTGRNTGYTVDISTPELLRTEILDDATREWLGEGQTFFLLKRYNVTDRFVPADGKLDYVLPIPKSNIVF